MFGFLLFVLLILVSGNVDVNCLDAGSRANDDCKAAITANVGHESDGDECTERKDNYQQTAQTLPPIRIQTYKTPQPHKIELAAICCSDNSSVFWSTALMPEVVYFCRRKS
ncbi:hypothetical protein [Hyphomicrobium sp.]|uniref:hypothetical protein n=1 Tax=Hyphomicrobium sp. TaxID=82 RepID=UPI000FB3F878|nr:hypothetical protein [Hyphomicrobium sp.]RUO97760.1 MAG: hypothetical protein EKK30_13535 [Hyphomicrobium sp.]